MQIINSIEQLTPNAPVSIALGRFDGMHLGHRRVIEAAADFEGAVPAVFTFEQSPQGVISGKMVYSLLTEEQKRKKMKELGVELYICSPFSDVRDMLPQEFVLMLKERLNAVHISCGFNFTFGMSAKGNAAVLKEICSKYGIALTVVPPVEQNGEPVSSSAIRDYLQNGDIEAATRMLGYRFNIELPVTEGDKRGRTLDFPTINQKIPHNFIHLRYGVYATKTEILGTVYKSVSNFGMRPTVGSENLSCETHIIGYNGELYGESVKVEFYQYLREEVSFSSLDELKAAIANDRQAVINNEY